MRIGALNRFSPKRIIKVIAPSRAHVTSGIFERYKRFCRTLTALFLIQDTVYAATINKISLAKQEPCTGEKHSEIG